jgi:hypothetical protein
MIDAGVKNGVEQKGGVATGGWFSIGKRREEKLDWKRRE